MKDGSNTNIPGSWKPGSNSDPTGFVTSGYIVKKGTPQGDGATFNKMPPGMDIMNQDFSDIRDLPMKKVTDMDYPGDGAF